CASPSSRSLPANRAGSSRCRRRSEGPMAEIKEIGFIGLGNMGGRIARRVRDAGWSITGFDVDPTLAADAELAAASSSSSLVAGADAVFLSLPDSSVVERVVYGEDGVLGACREGQVVVDLSTADPASTRRIHADLGAKGVEYVDAGI